MFEYFVSDYHKFVKVEKFVNNRPCTTVEQLTINPATLPQRASEGHTGMM